jgi:hypothetical protein
MTEKITVWLPPLLKDLLETMAIDEQIMVAQMGTGFYKYERPMRKRIGHMQQYFLASGHIPTCNLISV